MNSSEKSRILKVTIRVFKTIGSAILGAILHTQVELGAFKGINLKSNSLAINSCFSCYRNVFQNGVSSSRSLFYGINQSEGI